MKNKLYKSLLLSSILFLSITNYSCQISTACHKVGYGQQIHSTYFDKEKSIGYFVYSYFTDKNVKQYSLYKVDLKGNAEEIIKLKSVKIEQKDYLNSKLLYTYRKLDDNTLIVTEQSNYNNVTDSSIGKFSTNYHINVKDKKIVYKVDENNGIKKIFSPNKDKYFYLDGFEKSTNLSFVDMKNMLSGNINIGDNVSLPKDKFNYIKTSYIYNWIDNNNILIYSIEEDILKELFVYTIKDNNIIKTNQYTFKENEPQGFNTNNFKVTNKINPISLENNIFIFYSNLTEKKELKSNKIDYYYSSIPYSNTYKLDFSKNELSLLDEFKLSETLPQKEPIFDDESDKSYFIVGKDLIYTGGSKDEHLLDYREKLTKSYYDNDLICGNDLSFSRVN